jgi:hypothetical protein
MEVVDGPRNLRVTKTSVRARGVSQLADDCTRQKLEHLTHSSPGLSSKSSKGPLENATDLTSLEPPVRWNVYN